jgi:hypothetical protein
VRTGSRDEYLLLQPACVRDGNAIAIYSCISLQLKYNYESLSFIIAKRLYHEFNSEFNNGSIEQKH